MSDRQTGLDMTLEPATGAGRKVIGRPRRLTLVQIVEAAQAVGLENLTMRAVANRLGVSTAVLYGYIAGRDELVSLAAARITDEVLVIHDTGQHWSVYTAQTARMLYKVLTGPGQLVSHYLSGALGPEVEIDRAEAWLEKLTACGFSAEHASLIHRQVGEIVIGGAVTVLHLRALDLRERPFSPTAITAIDKRSNDNPLLASVRHTFAQRKQVWQSTLLTLLEGLAATRGEALDRAAIESALTPL